MNIGMFDTHRYERDAFEQANRPFGYTIHYFEARLNAQTAALARGHDCVCCFVHDSLTREVLSLLSEAGIRLVALRSAGFNNVDLVAAAELGLPVVRVPEYSPHAVAEHTVALILALNRQIPRAYWRVRDANFSLERLVGFDLFGKTVGVVGTGRIGRLVARIMAGFGCRVLAFDAFPNTEAAAEGSFAYVTLDELLERSDIVSLHVPLTPDTYHIVGASALRKMKRGVMLINTGRGALIDTRELIQALKSGHIGYAGLDVYEEEEAVFFRDLSGRVLQDDVLARLLTFPNVLMTSHQAFLTHEALDAIAGITLKNIRDFESGKPLVNAVTAAVNIRPAGR